MDEIKQLMELYSIEKDVAEQLAKKIALAVKFKVGANTEEEKRQADINFDILTKEIPLVLKAMVLESKVSDRLVKVLQAVIKIVSKAI